DNYDYRPGDTAVFTASDVTIGGTVEFSVAHVNAGADSIYGTADDLYTHDLLGTQFPWLVTDGGAGDLDGIANGTIHTSWLVNADAAAQAFLLSGTDLTTGTTATTNFIDAAHFNDLTVNGNVTINNAIFSTAVSTVGAGTGKIQAFEQLQANGKAAVT